MSVSFELRFCRALIGLCALTFALSACASPTVKVVRPGPPLAQAPVLDAAAARDQINAYRASKGLKPLVLDAKLNVAAKVQARDIAKRNKLDHTGSDGSTPWQRIVRAGYHPQMVAENIAAGQKDFAEVLNDWEHSPAHNRNLLLPDAHAMGIAVVYDAKTRFRSFWALDLASPALSKRASNP